MIFFFYVEFWNCSPPPSLPNSQPPTREASPAPLMMGNNARTPPPKRWKRSFDMAHPGAPARKDGIPSDQPLSLVRLRFSVLPTICNRLIYLRKPNFIYWLQIAEDYSHSRPQDYEPVKRFCEPNSTTGGQRSISSSSGSRTLPYPHSMPTSPTMFERGNEARYVIGVFNDDFVFEFKRDSFKSQSLTKT